MPFRLFFGTRVQHAAMVLLALAAITAPPAMAGGLPTLQAGAAKVEITPREGQPPDAVHDGLFVRALFVDNGSSCAVFVSVDQAGLFDPIVSEAVRRASASTRCPAANIIVSATHTHSGGTQMGGIAGGPAAQRIVDGIVAAVEAAARAVRPVTLGFGTAAVDLNINRDLYHEGAWVQGPNPAGPSDKTLAVVAFIGTDRVPVAVLMHYAMHPIHFFLSGVVSADFPGHAAQYVEQTYGGRAVALFVQGASGDQNPKLLEVAGIVPARLGAGELKQTADMPATLGPPRPGPQAARPAGPPPDLMNLPPVADKDQAPWRKALARTAAVASAMGAVIGATTVDLVRTGMARRAERAEIWSGQETISCPGRDRPDMVPPGAPGSRPTMSMMLQGVRPDYQDGAEVAIKVGLLRLGDIHFVWVNGEVYTEVAQRLKRESPQAHTMMLTLTNGMANSGYIYADRSAEHLTFQVIGSRLKPGCAEGKIVDAALRLVAASKGR